jgi:RND superfamily putative drug exporter
VFAAIGRFSYRHRRLIVAAWVVAFAAGLAATFSLSPELKGGGFSNASAPAQEALALMQQRLHTGTASISIVFTSPSLPARSRPFERAEATALAAIAPKAFPGLEAVQTFASTGDPTLISKDGRASLAQLVFNASLDTVQTQVPRIRAALRGHTLTTYVTGEPAVYADLENLSAKDLRTAETYALPLALGILLLVFGSVTAAALPLVGGGMAVSVTLGVVYLLAQRVDLSIFVLNTASMLGLAVGIDYSLFVVSRFREEIAGGRSVADAVEQTVAHAGRAIAFSGLAVVIGLLGLVAFQYMSLRSIGIGGAIVVFFSVAAALTLLPAVLGMLGPRVDSLRVLPMRHEGRFWQRWSDWVMKRPWLVLAFSIGVIALFTSPFAAIRVNVPTATSLPTTQESRQGYDILQQRFSSAALDPAYSLLTFARPGDPFAKANLAALYGYGQRLAKLGGVASVSSIVNQPGLDSASQVEAFWQSVHRRPPAAGTTAGGGATPPAGASAAGTAGAGASAAGTGATPVASAPPPAGASRAAAPSPARLAAARRLAATTTAAGTVLFSVTPAGDPQAAPARRLAVAVRSLAAPPGMTAHIAGLSAGVQDFLSAIYGRFPWVILYVFVVTYLVLLALLRSVVLPLKAVLMNVLSILSSFGALVFVFQQGHFQSVLGFTSTGSIDATLPVLMFCTIFGVSMDYEVFLLTRMREAWEETHDNRRAVGFGLARTGRVITSAALIIVIVAGSFAFTSVLITKAIGVGLAVAIALDATVVRVLLVPATMRILGWVNWWRPQWLERLLPGGEHTA